MPRHTIEEYDQEPVYCCKECLSLRIRSVEDQDYCDYCGSTDVAQQSIEEWAVDYAALYGEDKVIRHISIFKSRD